VRAECPARRVGPAAGVAFGIGPRLTASASTFAIALSRAIFAAATSDPWKGGMALWSVDPEVKAAAIALLETGTARVS
jgi:hypothetical protein